MTLPLGNEIDAELVLDTDTLSLMLGPLELLGPLGLLGPLAPLELLGPLGPSETEVEGLETEEGVEIVTPSLPETEDEDEVGGSVMETEDEDDGGSKTLLIPDKTLDRIPPLDSLEAAVADEDGGSVMVAEVDVGVNVTSDVEESELVGFNTLVKSEITLEMIPPSLDEVVVDVSVGGGVVSGGADVEVSV